MAVRGAWFTDQEKPGIPIEYRDPVTNTVVDFSSGYTFSAQIVRGTTKVVTQTTNMTGAATSPNFVMSEWDAATLTAIAADLTALGIDSYNYEFRPYARANSKDEVPTAMEPVIIRFKAAAV